MRRKDRERSPEFAWGVVDQCEYAVLSMVMENGTPYGVPLSIARQGERIYFHGAMEGRKVETLRVNPQACLVCVGDTQREELQFTTRYESAIAVGPVTEVTDREEKIRALYLLCQRHTPRHMDAFDQTIQRSLDQTAVFRLDVTEITGKCHP